MRACRSGFIDKQELRQLIQSTDLGLQPATATWLVDSVVENVLKSYDKVCRRHNRACCWTGCWTIQRPSQLRQHEQTLGTLLCRTAMAS